MYDNYFLVKSLSLFRLIYLSWQVPTHHRSQHDKKEQTQLSPVKKRVKEGTPPSEQLNYVNSSNRRNHSPNSNAHWQHASSHQQVSF